MLVDGLLQSRMIRGEPRAGIMHCVIFTGFLVLLARKVQLIVVGYLPDFVYPGWLGGLFAGAKDFVELAVLAAVGYAFYRRFVQKPDAARSESRGDPDPLADRGDHGDRSRVRRLPLRAVRRRRPGHRPRAQLCGGRFGAGVDVRRPPPRHAARRLAPFVLAADADGVRVPGAAAGGRAFPHRHGTPRTLLRARRSAQSRAFGRSRPRDERRRRRGRSRRRAHGARPQLEGRLRCLHLHRVRALQDRLPDLSHRTSRLRSSG